MFLSRFLNRGRGGKNASHSSRTGVFLVILVLTAAEFFVDCVTPLGTMDWLWYFAPLLLSAQMGSRIFPFLLVLVITVLIFAGWHFSPPGIHSYLALTARGMGVGVLWAGAILIAERIRAERKLQEEGQLNASVLADQIDAISRFTADGTFIFVNDFYCCYFGKKREELLGHKWTPMAWPEDLPMIQSRLRELSPTNPVVIIENRVRNLAGEIRWMQFSNRAIFNARGRLLELQSVGRDVTDRRRAEDSLRESEQRFRQLAENIEEIFWLFDVTQNRIIYISPHYEKLWGRTCEALYRDPHDWVKAVHPDDLERVKAFVKKQTDEPFHEEYRIVLPDGEGRWTRGRAFPVRDDSGCTYRIAGVHEDITRRKEVDEAFQRAQENYRNLAESSPDAIFIFDHELKIEYVNASAAGWLGKAPVHFVGHFCRELFPPEVASELSLRSVFDSGKPLSRERKMFFQTEERSIETRLLPLRDSRGEVNHVMGISRDMTTQRRVEDSLKEREQWSQKILETAVEGFFRVDLQGCLLDVNEAYCRMSGYSREELLSMCVADLSVNEPTSEKIALHVDLIVKNGSDRFETRHRRKDGTIFDVEVVATYLKLHGYHIFSLIRDITERKQLEQEVLKISAHERQRIGYDLHDGLGQHLAGVAFKAKVLEEMLSTSSPSELLQAREIVGLINQAISQTRTLARSLAPVEVEMNGLIAALENLAAETRRHFSIGCHFRNDVVNLNFDSHKSTMLYRIAQEAIHNAFKHGGAESIEMIMSASTDDKILFTVRDNGRGFLSSAGSKSGLGLRIMRYRADSMGGSLTVTSEPGKGTEIHCIMNGSPSSK